MRMKTRLLLICALSFTSCGDPQQRAIAELTQHGYSLSPEEYHRAAQRGDVEVLDAFLRAGTFIDVPDAQQQTAFILCVQHRQTAAAVFLAEKGASRSSSKHDLLTLAARSGELRLLDLLLVDQKAPRISAAMLAAAEEGHAEMLSMLLQHAATSLDLNAALLASAKHGDLACADLLLRHGAEADAQQQPSGSTALHAAAAGGHLDLLRLFLQRGARQHVLDASLRSLWEVAAEKAHPLLKQNDARAATSPSIIGTRLQGPLELHDTCWSDLPLRLSRVEQRVAILQMPESLHVRPGERIGETPWQLEKIIHTSKAIPAELLPSIIVRHMETGEALFLTANRQTQVSPRGAILLTSDHRSYLAYPGDTFHLGEQACEVIEVTPIRCRLRENTTQRVIELRLP
jgi:hypothetical protein